MADGAEGLQVVQRALAPAAVNRPDVVDLPKMALHWSADHLVELRGSERKDINREIQRELEHTFICF